MVDLNTLESWSETASSNDNIGGISIAENATQVSDLNNALREFMAQEAAWLGDDTLASASTTDLGSVPGRYVTITGTTTITAFGTIKAGTIKYVKFSGALTLTHNATSLILLGGASRTTAAGDVGIYVSEGSGNWREVDYRYANGAVVANARATFTVNGDSAQIKLERSGASAGSSFIGADNNSLLDVRDSALATKFNVDQSGHIETFGGQIKFPATQAASADANTLDDYEEGTFTPTIIGTTSAGTATYSVQTGYYTKIGRLVTVEIALTWTGHTGTGNMRVAGLPFTAAATPPFAIVYSAITFTNPPMAFASVGTEILLRQAASGGAYTDLPIDAAGTFLIAGSYIV